MVFSSLEFIFVFLPIFLIIYAFAPKKYKNFIILLASIVFYTVGSINHPEYIALILLSSFITYFLGRFTKKNKIALIVGILYNIGTLVFFKYYNFILSILFDLFKLEFTKIDLALPIGISFYTFQLISYLIDVYKQKTPSEKNFLKFLTYVLMFPKLISGPIVDYSSIKYDLEYRKHSRDKFMLGCKYFIVGLAYKVLLADKVGLLWNEIQTIGIDSISTPLSWLGALSISLQLYFDFYGYSLMAIGIGHIIGFDLPENFDNPYLSTSMTEFWRRWHITLSQWFRDYIYIPLGGNRKGKLKTIRNLLVVWILTGLWHGASYNFLIWGIGIFIILVIEKIGLKKLLDKHKFVSHIYMIFLILIMWTVFSVTNISELGIMLSKMFSTSSGIYAIDFVKYAKQYGALLIAGVICCTSLPQKILLKDNDSNFRLILLFVLFWVSVYFLYNGLHNPFLYFQF